MLIVGNLSTFYGNFEAIKNVSIAVEKGELVAIIGANGAGKTTLLKTICGLLKPKSGRIFLNGEDITFDSVVERVKRGLVYTPEGRKLFPKMTVMENLEMGAYTCPREFKRNLEMVFALFPILKERHNQKAGSLSGGEQQMLAVGRTLMSGPQVILFDEPSTGLAPVVVKQLASAITQLNQQGKTIVLVEQNVHVAFQICSKAYVLENGRIVLQGDCSLLRQDPKVKRAYLGA